MINQKSKEECFLKVADNTQDYTSCFLVVDLEETNQDEIDDAEALVDDCLYKIASQRGKIQACYLFFDDSKEEECIEKALDKSLLFESCLVLKTLGEKNSCFKDLAVESKVEATCEFIEGDFDLLGECYKELALEKKDFLLCNKIPVFNKILVDDCYYDLALQEENAAYCEFVQAPRKYFDCFVEIANSLDNVSICLFPQKDYLSSFTIYPIKDLCIKEYSISQNDTSYCPRINHSDVLEACMDLNVLFT